MNRKIKNIVLTIAIISMIFAMPLNFALAGGTEDVENTKLQQDLEYLGNMIEFIKLVYGDEITEEELIEGAMKGLFLNLDEYSQYYTPEEYKGLKEDVSGDFGGIGIHITEKNGHITVIAPIEGTPGFKAGIKPGDRIVSVDDEDIEGLTLNQAANLLRGEPGTKVKVGIIREGTEGVLYFDITREIIEVNPVSYEILDDNLGYIRITNFNNNTFENITEALDEFDSKHIDKLIIDLRNNPGGFLTEVVEVLQLFVPEGPIVHVKNMDDSIETFESYLEKPRYKLAVLVNEGSASASEIFAGAVQDTGVGTIIGTNTYGKGTVQSIYPLVNGGGIKITIAEYFTANMNKVNGVGIKPDVVVENFVDEQIIDENKLAYLNKERKPTLGTVGLDVLVAEEILQILGYDVDEPDGVLDRITFNEIKRFQTDKGLHGYGVLDFATQDELLFSLKEYAKSQNPDKQLEKAIEVLSTIEN